MTGNEERECWKEYAAAERHLIWSGVKNALRQRCKSDNDFSMNRPERWFHTLKFLICVLFNLTKKPKPYADSVEVAQIYYTPLYAGWEAEWVEVGHGLFRNWFYEKVHDGDWNM